MDKYYNSAVIINEKNEKIDYIKKAKAGVKYSTG